jgi:hypothetical protein
MRTARAFPLLLGWSLAAATPTAAAEWSLQLSLGAAANLESSLTVRQEGFGEIRVTDAEYETRPLESPPYYAWRVGCWNERRGWELELIHHKLFLRDPPPEIERLSISHGYNLVTVNHGWRVGRYALRLGAGGVLAHPESTVRGRVAREESGLFDSGYHWTGPVLQGAVERRFELGERWFLAIEGKASAARAEVPVANGEAEVPNFALHGLFGVGYRL